MKKTLLAIVLCFACVAGTVAFSAPLQNGPETAKGHKGGDDKGKGKGKAKKGAREDDKSPAKKSKQQS
jgi:hypothetical protein